MDNIHSLIFSLLLFLSIAVLLRGDSTDQVAEYDYFQIANNGSLTKAQKSAALAQWANQNGLQQAYANYTAKSQMEQQALYGNVSQNLGGPLLQLFQNIWAIMQDQTLTKHQECSQFRAALNSSAPLMRSLLAQGLRGLLSPIEQILMSECYLYGYHQLLIFDFIETMDQYGNYDSTGNSNTNNNNNTSIPQTNAYNNNNGNNNVNYNNPNSYNNSGNITT